MNKPKIMVVEDERIIAEDIQLSLQKFGYEVTSIANSGEKALQSLKQNVPDLVLMDIVLQGEMSGIDTAEKIRKLHDVPVIYLTSYSNESILNQAKRTEPYGYILKPFADKELHSTVEMALYKHQIEKKLKESEAFNYALFEHNPIETIVVDRNARVVGYNLAKKNSGHRVPEIGTLMYKEYASHHDLDMYEQLKECIENGALKEFSARPYKDQYLNIRMAPFPAGAIITSQDITNQIYATEALRKSEEQYRGLFESMAQGVIYFDRGGLIVNMNPAACNLLDFTGREYMEFNIKDILCQPVDETDKPLPIEQHPILNTLNTGEKVTDFVMGFTTLKGNKRWVIVSANPVFRQGESKPHQVFTTLTDVTFRREIEFALQNRNSQLASLNTIAQTVSSTLDLKDIIGKTLNKVIELANFKYGLIFLKEGTQVDYTAQVRAKVPQSLREKMADLLLDEKSDSARALKSQKTTRCGIRKMIDRMNPSEQKNLSSFFGLECLIVPLTAGQITMGVMILISEADRIPPESDFDFYTSIGGFIGLVIRNARLYNEVSQTLEKLRVTQDKLVQSEKLAVLGGLTSNVVHEIGNPLGAITNSVDVLKSRVQLEGRMRELMDIISWETERLNRTIIQLREFSKPRQFSFRECNLSEIVRKGINLLKQDVDLMQNRKVYTELPDHPLMAVVDHDAIEQIVINLVKNGLQAAPKTGIVRIVLKSQDQRSSKCLEIRILDNGPGIKEENLDRIFEPYFSTKARGMGLGMYLVKQIVEAHEGQIKVENIGKGEGTAVIVTIPIQEESHG